MLKVFIISDFYTHFYHTTDPQLFYQEIARYINTMLVSQKQNTYQVHCLFFEEAEYETYKNNFNKVKRPTLKANLKLVETEEGEPDGNNGE